MKFKELPIGARFVFASEEDPKFRFSGMATGPWEKVGHAIYRKVNSNELQHVRVGTINAAVVLKNPRPRSKVHSYSFPGHTTVYKRYTIGETLQGEIFITRDGHTITHNAGTREKAKKIIDELTEFDKNPRPRIGSRLSARRSSATGRKPSRRLVARRRRNTRKGYFPNPRVTRAARAAQKKMWEKGATWHYDMRHSQGPLPAGKRYIVQVLTGDKWDTRAVFVHPTNPKMALKHARIAVYKIATDENKKARIITGNAS